METRAGVARLHPPTDTWHKEKEHEHRKQKYEHRKGDDGDNWHFVRPPLPGGVVVGGRRLSENVNCLECF
jgi:hypothetical protein